MNAANVPELKALLSLVYPPIAFSVSENTFHRIVIAWEDGPSVPQVQVVCRPLHPSSLVLARRFSMECLRHVAQETLRSHGLSPERVVVGMQPDGATLRSHRNCLVGGRSLRMTIEENARTTSFYTRPPEGLVLREDDEVLPFVSLSHLECYVVFRKKLLTLALLSGEPQATGVGTLQAVPLGTIDPASICDLTGCGRRMDEEPRIRP